MKRHVIQIAESTQLISLPRKWAKQFGIKKGDELDVVEEGNRLIIHTAKEYAPEQIKYDATGQGYQLIHRAVSALYKAGYDEIQLTFSCPEELKIIQNTVNNEFIGFEVLEERRNQLFTRKISDIDYKEIENMIKRTFLFLITIAEESAHAIEKQDFVYLENIKLRDVNVNKLTDYCRRALNKGGTQCYKKPNPVYYIVEELEKVGDCYRDLCDHIILNKIKLSKDLLKVYEGITDLLRNASQLFSNLKLDQMKEFIAKRESLHSDMVKYTLSMPHKEIMPSLYIFRIMEKIYDMNGPIMAARL